MTRCSATHGPPSVSTACFISDGPGHEPASGYTSRSILRSRVLVGGRATLTSTTAGPIRIPQTVPWSRYPINPPRALIASEAAIHPQWRTTTSRMTEAETLAVSLACAVTVPWNTRVLDPHAGHGLRASGGPDSASVRARPHWPHLILSVATTSGIVHASTDGPSRGWKSWLEECKQPGRPIGLRRTIGAR